MTEIIKGIPLPDKPTGRPRKYNLPLDAMVVGDHVLVKTEEDKVKEAKVIRNAIARYVKKNPNRVYTVRKLDNGIGIWRVS
tara:strand:- start:299 stop:541 length:243 start_codon:yes stop_codon:yes gene_type:complete